MKLTDEKILELFLFYGDETWTESIRGFTASAAINFARAILKEAGAEEYEPAAWMSDSEQRLFSYGHSAFVSTYSEPVRSDGIVLYKKRK